MQANINNANWRISYHCSQKAGVLPQNKQCYKIPAYSDTTLQANFERQYSVECFVKDHHSVISNNLLGFLLINKVLVLFISIQMFNFQ